ncbi:MAG: carbohydrate ABC transporter permease [Chloroflexi bacterium]|nr:carbohydrate ABC transporter permease [Chloroflexota bacterium]
MAELAAGARMAGRKPTLPVVLSRIGLYGTITAVSLATLFPIYWMLVCTFQPNLYTLHWPPPLIPVALTFNQFGPLFQNHPLAVWLRSSLFIASIAMVTCTILTVFGAYALSSLRWKLRTAYGMFLLLIQMLPEILTIIPLYVIYRRLDLLDKIPAVSAIDAAFTLPICIWILKNVFDAVPAEVLDAAVVDGCTELSVLWKIVLPLSTPGLVAVAVVSFFSAWNEFLFASIMLASQDNTPATVGIPTLKMFGFTPVEQYMGAGLLFSILPVVFYLSMQRYIISGLTAGAVKG